MTDYHRMEWQYRANKLATVILVLLVFLDADEVRWAFKYNFPWWDDMMMIVSLPLTYLAWFVRRHTDLYRKAIDG